MPKIMLDAIDHKLLDLLRKNARLTLKELGMQVNLSSTPVYERMRRLEREGYILKYSAIVDQAKLMGDLQVFCSIKLRRLSLETTAEFVETIRSIPQVVEAWNISGRYDYMLKIQAPDMKTYQEFILNVLGRIDSISSLESTFVMDQVKG